MGESKRRKAAGYVPRVMANLPTRPGVTHIYVQHDRWCGHFSGRECNCNPDIQRRVEGSNVVEVIGPDGAVVETLQRN